MPLFIIEDKTLIAVLNYLSDRPFKEVVGLIQQLQKVKPIKEEEGKKDADNTRP